MKNVLFSVLISLGNVLLTNGLSAQVDPNTSGPLIRIETSLGNITVRLYDATPVHRDNMLRLIDENYFDDQLFHRVIKDFMIQGGDPHSAGAAKGQRLGNGGPGYTLAAEFREGLIHKKGALAAARQGDRENPEKRSSGSQFYLVQGRVFTSQELQLLREQRGVVVNEAAEKVYTTQGGTPHLDGAYTVFGEITEGFDVLDRIASVPTDAYNRPVEDVSFRIRRVE
ncbi:MAG: peptidylprolyl isomerase [Bacteroidales bacterium]